MPMQNIVDKHTTVPSVEYKHDNACSLFNQNHTVSEDVATVVEAFNELEGHKAVASGCNSCSSHIMHNNPDVESHVYYVAQGNSSRRVCFGYDSKETAYKLIDIAAENNIEYDWNGDVSQKVIIG